MLKRGATKDANATETDTTAPQDVDTDEDLELDAIDLYQAANLEADIDPDYRDALHNADRDLLHNYAVPDSPSSTPVADFPITANLSEIIAAQKTDDF